MGALLFIEINKKAREGLANADRNQDHAKRLATAKQAIQDQKPVIALQQLAPIAATARYGPDADKIAKEARALLVQQSLSAATRACQNREWKSCQTKAIVALDHDSQSTQARSLIETAEKMMKKSRVPFTPWATR